MCPEYTQTDTHTHTHWRIQILGWPRASSGQQWNYERTFIKSSSPQAVNSLREIFSPIHTSIHWTDSLTRGHLIKVLSSLQSPIRPFPAIHHPLIFHLKQNYTLIIPRPHSVQHKSSLLHIPLFRTVGFMEMANTKIYIKLCCVISWESSWLVTFWLFYL